MRSVVIRLTPAPMNASKCISASIGLFFDVFSRFFFSVFIRFFTFVPNLDIFSFHKRLFSFAPNPDFYLFPKHLFSLAPFLDFFSFPNRLFSFVLNKLYSSFPNRFFSFASNPDIFTFPNRFFSFVLNKLYSSFPNRFFSFVLYRLYSSFSNRFFFSAPDRTFISVLFPIFFISTIRVPFQVSIRRIFNLPKPFSFFPSRQALIVSPGRSFFALHILLFFIMMRVATAQPNHPTVYTFLEIPTSARLNAMGGVAPAVSNGDVHLAAWNPALIAGAPTGMLGLSVANYIADIRAGQAVTLRESPKTGGKFLYSAGFINYGELERTDPAGNSIGRFAANEVVLQGGWGTRFAKQFTAGASVKFIGSFLSSYSSGGLAFDMGAGWGDTSGRTHVALQIRNFGTTLWSYTPLSQNGRLPLDVQLSVTNRLEHMPLRWGIVVHNLHNWKLRYSDPADPWYNPQLLFAEQEETPKKGSPWIDEAFRHLVLQTELLLSKNLQFQLSYNHQRRKELTLPNRSGSSGFALGFALHTKRFRLDYSRAAQTLSGNTHQFSVTARVSSGS